MSGDQTGSIDVVIVTRNRPLRLEALLGDLRAQTHRATRVTIVDDSDQTIDWPVRFPELPIDSVRPERRLFISKAKNTGARRGDSEYIAFVDDDNRVPSDLLARLTEDLVRSPRLGAVMPGVLYHRRPDLVWVYATPFGPDRWGFDLIGRNAAREARWEQRMLPTDALPNLSMVRRTAYNAIGGFDEQLPINSSADFCQRLKRSGWEVVADSGVLTQHDVEPPGTPGYWAEHTVIDPARARHEVADWFRFQRRWNHGGTFFRFRATYHALGFLVPGLLAAAVRPEGHPVRLLASMIRGYREGWVTPLYDWPRTGRA